MGRQHRPPLPSSSMITATTELASSCPHGPDTVTHAAAVASRDMPLAVIVVAVIATAELHAKLADDGIELFVGNF